MRIGGRSASGGKEAVKLAGGARPLTWRTRSQRVQLTPISGSPAASPFCSVWRCNFLPSERHQSEYAGSRAALLDFLLFPTERSTVYRGSMTFRRACIHVTGGALMFIPAIVSTACCQFALIYVHSRLNFASLRA